MKAPSADIDERVMNSQGLSVACYDVTEQYTADCGDDTKVAMHDDLAGSGRLRPNDLLLSCRPGRWQAAAQGYPGSIRRRRSSWPKLRAGSSSSWLDGVADANALQPDATASGGEDPAHPRCYTAPARVLRRRRALRADNSMRDFHAFVADVDSRARDKLPNLMLGLPAECAGQAVILH